MRGHFQWHRQDAPGPGDDLGELICVQFDAAGTVWIPDGYVSATLNCRRMRSLTLRNVGDMHQAMWRRELYDAG